MPGEIDRAFRLDVNVSLLGTPRGFEDEVNRLLPEFVTKYYRAIAEMTLEALRGATDGLDFDGAETSIDFKYQEVEDMARELQAQSDASPEEDRARLVETLKGMMEETGDPGEQ